MVIFPVSAGFFCRFPHNLLKTEFSACLLRFACARIAFIHYYFEGGLCHETTIAREGTVSGRRNAVLDVFWCRQPDFSSFCGVSGRGGRFARVSWHGPDGSLLSCAGCGCRGQGGRHRQTVQQNTPLLCHCVYHFGVSVHWPHAGHSSDRGDHL